MTDIRHKSLNPVSLVYPFVTLMAAISIGWFILVQANYFYSFWYDQGGIKEAIQEFSPQNRYRDGFGNLERDQYLQLFNQISYSVHHDGIRLSDITYQPQGSSQTIPLLHYDEIVHLEDVSVLMKVFDLGFVLSFILWVSATIYLHRNRQLPSSKQYMITLSLVFGALVLILSTLGFGTVFEQLHIWIFPDGHKWNFYYQDSLMSTLMWAPNLFLYIAIAWLIIAIILLALILKASKFLYEYFNLMSLAKETSAMRINSSTLKNTQPIDS